MIAASPKITRYRIVFTAAYVFPSFDDHHETEPSRLFLPTENPEAPFLKGDRGLPAIALAQARRAGGFYCAVILPKTTAAYSLYTQS